MTAAPEVRGLVVAALGGNALLQRGQPMEAAVQAANVAVAAAGLARVARRHPLVVTHGNGPQIGLLALQAEAYQAVRPYPLDVLGAETEGMIGYLLQLALRNELPGREVATLLTQVVVDAADPAFSRPSKPVGPVYPEAEARRLARERGWAIAPDGGGFRRVVPSPEPREVVGLASVRALLGGGTIVVCSGGGGIPCVAEAGSLRGVEAVIDKDLSAALLARRLGAACLLLLTDVPSVQLGFGTPAARAIARATVAELRGQVFAAGSMGPKVEAACRFAEATGRAACIGSLADALAMLDGRAGTRVLPG